MSGKRKIILPTLIAVVVGGMVPFLINAADIADDVLVYRGGGDTSIPEYKLHDDGGFEAEATAQDITSMINFIKVAAKSGNSSTEKVMCTKDSANDINCQVHNGAAWGNLLEVSANAGVQKGFDIAYEQVSGEAMVCYRSPAINTQTPRCRVWNGSAWGAEFSALAVGGAINTVRLVSDPASDYLALLTKDGSNDVNVQIWNGSAWGNLQEVSANAGGCASCLPFDASWEKSGDDLVVAWFDDATDAIFSREFDKTSLWAAQITNVITGLSTADNIYVETDSSSDPTSSVVLVAVIDDNNTLNANSWNGSVWGTASELSANINGSVAANTHLFDLAFEQRPDYDAILTYGSTANLLKYRIWDSSGLSWGLEQALPTAVEAKDWQQLASDPNRQNIMLTTVGTVDDVDTIEWNGSAWDAGWTSHDIASNDVNWNAWFAYDREDEDHTWPVVSFNSAVQKIDGSGLVDISIEDADDGLHANSLKIEYETDGDGACNGPWANATLAGPATADTNDTGGPPDINNGQTYQVGSGIGTRIVTYAGANTIQFDWDSTTDLPAGNATYCLRATGYDDEVDSATPATIVLVVDNVLPTGLANFISMGAASMVQHINWTPVTETNFDHYEIWYGTAEADVAARAGSADVWDENDFLALATRTTMHTHITGLTPTTLYYYKIWAVDDFGNEQTVPGFSFTTDSVGNNVPEASNPDTISQAVDGTGYITFFTSIYDLDIEDVEMRMRFSPDNGVTFYNGHIISAVVTPGDLVPDDSFSIDNNNDFQIAHTDHIALNLASRHPVRLTVVWDSKSTLNQNGGLDGQATNVIIQVTPRDVQGEIGLDYDSTPFALDNSGPTLAEVTPVSSATTDTTPDYVFSSTSAGNITYGGACSSGTLIAGAGANPITFDIAPASEGSFGNCTIMVTDAFSNDSNILAVSPFIIDATVPSGLTALVAGANTQTTQVLNWTAVTETNFDHYEIWFGTSQANVQARGGAAVEWDNTDDAAIGTRTAATTTVTGLAPATTYYYKIWAVDIANQEETVADINIATDANNAPTGTITAITQATDGSMDVEVYILIDDVDDNAARAKIEYETDLGGGCDGPWALATISEPVFATYDDVGGEPNTDNGATYRLGTVANRRIITASGANAVQFQWDATNDLPTANNQLACLRLTANDLIVDQAVPDTLAATIDLVAPVVTAANISQQITSDTKGAAGVADVGDVVTFLWDSSAGGDNNSDLVSVNIDLTNYGGLADQTMYDNGAAGDAAAGDGIYTFSLTIPASSINTITAHPHVIAVDNFGNETVVSDDANISVNGIAPAPQTGGSGYTPAPSPVIAPPTLPLPAVSFTDSFDLSCIAPDAGRIKTRVVNLTLKANQGADRMVISADKDGLSLAHSVPYAAEYTFNLCDDEKYCADGVYPVYAKIFNNAGASSNAASCFVLFDTRDAPPLVVKEEPIKTSFRFLRPLFSGITHPDVKILQTVLNRDSRTRVAQTGPGASGAETSFFGRLTLNAVQLFQRLYGLAEPGDPGYGFVGPMTRGMLNKLLK